MMIKIMEGEREKQLAGVKSRRVAAFVGCETECRWATWPLRQRAQEPISIMGRAANEQDRLLLSLLSAASSRSALALVARELELLIRE